MSATQELTHATGYVVARQERGETDLFVTLLLDDGRIVRATARAARKSSRRFSAGLAPFVQYRFAFSRSRRRGTPSAYPSVDEANATRVHPGVLADLRRTSAAGVASVLVAEITPEVAADGVVFNLYVALLDALEKADARGSGAGLLRFVFRVFEHAGHPIVFDACVRCGRAAPPTALVHMRSGDGGVVCARCGGGPIVVRAADRRAMRAVANGDDEAFAPSMLAWALPFIGEHAPRAARTLDRAVPHWHAGAT